MPKDLNTEHLTLNAENHLSTIKLPFSKPINLTELQGLILHKLHFFLKKMKNWPKNLSK